MATRPSTHQARTYATCTHITMVRVYSFNLRCDSCGNHGPLGWLYCCSQDREELLRDSIACGKEVTFDDFGKQLIKGVQPRHRGPEKRAENAASFLEEMPTEKITKTYTSDQLLTIFNQRKNLGNVLRKESIHKTAATVKESSTHDLGEFLDQSSKPWVPNRKEECQYKICSYCRPGGADRAYISLDGVANGDIPATAATGFGFHLFGKRPVVNSRLLENMGLRSSSTVSSSSTPGAINSSPPTPISDDGDVDAHLAHLVLRTGLSIAPRDPRPISPYPIPQSNLPRSPGSPNLAAQAGPRESVDGDTSFEDSTAKTTTLPCAAGDNLGKNATDMEEHEKEEGKFSAKPLEVQNGVAVLEESVEMHAPDLMTQV